MTLLMTRITKGRAATCAVLAAMVAVLTAVPARAQAPPPEVRGAQLLGAVQRGDQRCGQLQSGDFEAIGEFVMGRMAGSRQAHAAMEAQMRRMMGAGAEQRVHVFLGQRFSGCGGAALPARFGPMMGAVGAMMGGMMGNAGFGATGVSGYGVMGRAGPGGAPAYGMMGGSAYGGGYTGTDDDEGPSAAAIVGMMAVLIGAVALALLWLRPKRRSSGPQEVLEQRFARGELSAEEYRQKKQLLAGGKP